MTNISFHTLDIADNVQAGLARAPKSGKDPKRWSLYLFFRILPESELPKTIHFLIKDLLNFSANNSLVEESTDGNLFHSSKFPHLSNYISHPTLFHRDNKKTDETNASKESYGLFLRWLKQVLAKTESENDTTSDTIKEVFKREFSEQFQNLKKDSQDVKNTSSKKLSTDAASSDETHELETIFQKFFENFDTKELNDSDLYTFLSYALLRSGLFGKAPIAEELISTLGTDAIKKGLFATLAFDFLRQHINAPNSKLLETEDAINQGLIRSEATELAFKTRSNESFDKDVDTQSQTTPPPPLPINLGFTLSGLERLGVHQNYLNTFPDVFQEGMAARADILADTGPSSPSNWDGELGSKSIHGMINTGFHAPNVKLKYWNQLRTQVANYNRNGPEDQELRCGISVLFRLLGIEILHIELGENPTKNHDPEALPEYHEYNVEHFGFRDGISQPFIDMKLGNPTQGGGNPSRANSWEPIASGEIYLGREDQDGQCVNQPACKTLRDDSTYLVFRKLEQDVGGFREYLRNTYPDSESKQKYLSAQMVGRWPNGTPLVKAPTEELSIPEDELNNFRYFTEDPHGQACPLGSHIRRANPRDIGGRDSVKRHRILRRSMSYGGPFLPEGSLDKTQKRGLLFVAMNSRIDLQFELIQSRWLNSGEFLGQAGLDKCPLTGANSKKDSDKFYEAKALSPVRNLPRFVTTKGGDYFFVPSLTALKAIANKEFETTDTHKLDSVIDSGYTAKDPKTPSLFTTEMIKGMLPTLLNPKEGAVLIKPSAFNSETANEMTALNEAEGDILFVGKHADVVNVLKGDAIPPKKKSKKDKKKEDASEGSASTCPHASGENISNTGLRFSTKHYLDAGKAMLRGDKVILGTDYYNSHTADARRDMSHILNVSWQSLNTVLEENWKDEKTPYSIDAVIAEIVSNRSNNALRRVTPSGKIDLVQDLSTDVAYSIIVKLFGLSGPEYLTELAISLPFSKTNVGGLHPDWLSMISGEQPSRPDVATLQLWSIASFVALIGNVKMQPEIDHIARKAGSEFVDHIDKEIRNVREKPRDRLGKNLLECFVLNKNHEDFINMSDEKYFRHVRSLLAELVASTLTLLPATFGKLMQETLDKRINLSVLIPKLEAYNKKYDLRYSSNQTNADDNNIDAIYRFIYEMNRVAPSLELLFRYCENDTDINGIPVSKGQWVANVMRAANFDKDAFDSPFQFSLNPVMPGPERKAENYLMFGKSIGENRSEHRCWGRDKIAMSTLKYLLISASKLNGLKGVAGPLGEPVKVLGVTIGLPARFAAFQYASNG